uniref:C1q domain-containing protein n=1 Tax=Magallana gigas TaxID=29159 RepID=A0A8W8MEY0_MAGGI
MEEMLRMIQRQKEVTDKQTNTIEKQSVEIEKLRHRVKTLEKRQNNSRTSNGKVTYESTGHGHVTLSTEKELHNEETQFIRRLLAPEVAHNPVAFYAYISKDFGGVAAHHVFLYDTIITNQGNGYSKHTGAFTAPSTGVYAFCYTAYASGEHVAGETGDYGEVAVQLVHNGAYKGSIYVDTESHYEEEMSTGFAILMLQAGDVVLTMSGFAGIISGHVSGLTCWKCVGEECSGENFEEYSEKIHCEQGESCMKVVFEMVDYPSPLKYESVVRTCSRGPCEPITMETFNGCRGKTRSYRFYGCSIRTCCEKDYCNKTASITMGGFWASLLFPIFVIRIL